MSYTYQLTCKNCGAELDIRKAVDGVIECEYCGSKVTLPKENTANGVLQYLHDGESNLAACKFDDAFTYFQKASELDPAEPEAYWGMARASAKIQHIHDRIRNVLQPVCHEITDKKFVNNDYYQKALKLATAFQCAEYKQKAEEIDDIRRKFAAYKKQGLRYDTFICVKVTEEDNSERHTEDSRIAQKIYHELKDNGYSPFYSEEEIHNLTGTDYEAMILYALHSAGSMIVVCFNETYLQTPWVKNEYTRFIEMQREEDKENGSITIVFRGKPIEKIPGLSGKIQGIDWSGGTAFNELTKFIDRFMPVNIPTIPHKVYSGEVGRKVSTRQSVEKRQFASLGGSGSVSLSDAGQINLARQMLNQGDYGGTIVFLDRVIKNNPGISEAYWLRFLAENSCINEKEYSTSRQNDTVGFDSFEKAIAAAADKSESRKYYNTLFNRIVNLHKAKDFAEYIVLPDSDDRQIAKLADSMFEFALNTRDIALFQEVIKTVTDVDKYIDMNMRFAQIFDGGKGKYAIPYYQNILTVYEGHPTARYRIFANKFNNNPSNILDYASKEENLPKVEEELYSYGYNEVATEELYDACLHGISCGKIDNACRLFEFLMSMLPEDKNDTLINMLGNIVATLLKKDSLKYANKYNELLLSLDKLNDIAYFSRFIINHGSGNPLSIILYYDELYRNEDYLSAMYACTEKYPQYENIYLNIRKALGDIKDDFTYDQWDFVVKNMYVEKDSLTDANTIKKNATYLLDETTNGLIKKVFARYGVSSLSKLNSLTVDVTGDADLIMAGRLACAQRATIAGVLKTQAGAAAKNLAKQKKKEAARAEAARLAAIEAKKQKKLNKIALGIQLGGLAAAILIIFFGVAAVYYWAFGSFGEFWLTLDTASEGFVFFITTTVIFSISAIILVVLIFTLKKKDFINKIIFPVMIICTLLGMLFGASGNYANGVFTAGYSDGDAYIIKLYGEPVNYVMPDIYNYRQIVNIDDMAFAGKKLKTVKIGQYVQVIDTQAFYDCPNLTTVTLPASLSRIGFKAFANCPKMSDIYYAGTAYEWKYNVQKATTWDENSGAYTMHFLEESSIIDDLVFELKTDENGNSAYYIKEYKGSKITMMLPSMYEGLPVVGINSNVFSGKDSLVSVTVPEGYTYIGSGAFSGCKSLENLILPDSLTSFNSNAILNCPKLNYNTSLYSECLGNENNPYVVLVSGGYNASLGQNIAMIQDGCKIIYDNAFNDARSINYLTIPDSVRCIASSAFSYCSNITKLMCPAEFLSVIPKGSLKYLSVTCGDLPKQAVYNLSNLETLILSDSVTAIGEGAVSYCSKLTSVTLGSGLQTIEKDAFTNCKSLEQIKIPASVTGIGEYAFRACEALTSIKIPEGITEIKNGTFSNCKALTKVILPESITTIGNEAFSYCAALTDIDINKPGLEKIGERAFRGCSALKEITLPEALTVIENTTFRDCTSLQKMVIPDNVKEIKTEAFYNCSALRTVTVGYAVRTIASGAFSGCTKIIEVYDRSPFVHITKNSSDNGSIGYYAKNIYTEEGDNKLYVSDGFMLFINGSTKELVGYQGSATEIVIPDGVSFIYSEAFLNYTAMTSLVIPDSVTSIGSNPFNGCTNLEKVTMPTIAVSYIPKSNLTEVNITSGTSLSSNAFSGCSKLTKVTIADSVTSCSSSAFSSCDKIAYATVPAGAVGAVAKQSSLKELTITSGTLISANACYGCGELTKLTLPDTITTIGGTAFFNCNKLAEIYYEGDLEGWCKISGLNNLMQYGKTDKSVYIGGEKLSGEVEIPDGVTQIVSYAFYRFTDITAVTIPSSVTSIGDNAFYGCTGLTSIEIPATVTEIGSEAFYKCPFTYANIPTVAINKISKDNLTTLVINSGSSVPGSAFFNCQTLTSVSIAGSVTSLGTDSFYNCPITQLSIPVGLIGRMSAAMPRAKECLEDVTVFGGDVPEWAFNQYRIKKLTLGDGVTTIGDFAFSGTPVRDVDFGVDLKDTGSYSFMTCLGLESVELPDGLTRIGYKAFSGCNNLTKINIPDSVTTVGEDALAGTAITEIALPVSAYNLVRSLPEDSQLTVVFTGGSSLPNNALANLTNIVSVTLPESLTSIGSNAFSGCTGLTEIVIPNSVSSIGSNAFSGCTGLTEIVIPNSVSSVGSNALAETAITEIALPTAAYSILRDIPDENLLTVTFTDGSGLPDNALANLANIVSITLGDSITSIGSSAFGNCISLKEITISDNILTIGNDAFLNCPLKTVTMPISAIEKVPQGTVSKVILTSGESIPQSAFINAKLLTSITIPSSVTSIGSNAFSGCYRLAEVYNKSNLTIVEGQSDYGYVGCYALAVYTEDFESKVTVDSDGYILYIDGNDKILVGYEGQVARLTISDDITKIKKYAFAEDNDLTDIDIGDGVIEIGDYAFYMCWNLSNVNFGDSVADIGDNAFYYCSNLTDLIIPDSVTSIGRYAFQYCSKLTSVTIGNRVTSIGDYAFSYCSKLTSVTIGESVTSIGNSAFNNCYKLVEVYNKSELNITAGSYDNDYVGYYAINVYTPDSGRSKLSTDDDGYVICTVGEDIILVGYTGTETELTLPSNITKINRYAFDDYSNLTSVTIGDSVTSIGDYAFYYCRKLTRVTMGSGVTSIGSSAFYDCNSLTRIDYNGTTAKWNAISKGSYWNSGTGSYKVYCTDGT